MSQPDWWETLGEEWKFQPEPPRFAPGDKVVCVNASLTHELKNACAWWNRVGAPSDSPLVYPDLLEGGKLYVIRSVEGDRVFLTGIVAGRPLRAEIGFDETRFMHLSEYREAVARIRKRLFHSIMEEMDAYRKEVEKTPWGDNPPRRGRKKKTQKKEEGQ